jgi:hypothetical protein
VDVGNLFGGREREEGVIVEDVRSGDQPGEGESPRAPLHMHHGTSVKYREVGHHSLAGWYS